MKEEIRLGDKVKCKYTGFVGIVMAKTEYINGCVQFMICEKYDKKKATAEIPSIELPIDEQSLILIDKKLRKIPKEKLEWNIKKRQQNEIVDALEEDNTGGPSRRIARRNY